MNDAIQIVSVVVAVLIGYALGIYHCKRAIRDAAQRARDER